MRTLDRLSASGAPPYVGQRRAGCLRASAYQRSRPKRGVRGDDQPSRAVVGYTTHRRSACGFYLGCAERGPIYSREVRLSHSGLHETVNKAQDESPGGDFDAGGPDGSAMIAIARTPAGIDLEVYSHRRTIVKSRIRWPKKPRPSIRGITGAARRAT